MKRFFIFAGQSCEPNGGMSDFKIDCDNWKQARLIVKMIFLHDECTAWADIMDTSTGKFVQCFRGKTGFRTSKRKVYE